MHFLASIFRFGDRDNMLGFLGFRGCSGCFCSRQGEREQVSYLDWDWDWDPRCHPQIRTLGGTPSSA